MITPSFSIWHAVPTGIFRALLTFVFVHFSMFCQDSQAQQPPPDKLYTLQPGDELSVRVARVLELDQQVKVRPDGRISPLFAPEITVTGLTLQQLSQRLTEIYSTRYRSPEVSLALTHFAPMAINVGGEVTNPGAFPLQGPLTLAKAVVRAGGLRETARAEAILLIRNTDGVMSMKEYSLPAILSNPAEDPLLKPGDLIVAQKNVINIYVGGEVALPGLQAVQGRHTVLSAILKAGGPRATGGLKSVILLRNDGEKAELRKVDVNDILKKGAPDVALLPFDIVFVPKTRIATMNQFVDQYMRQLLPISGSAGFSYIVGGLNPR